MSASPGVPPSAQRDQQRYVWNTQCSPDRAQWQHNSSPEVGSSDGTLRGIRRYNPRCPHTEQSPLRFAHLLHQWQKAEKVSEKAWDRRGPRSTDSSDPQRSPAALSIVAGSVRTLLLNGGYVHLARGVGCHRRDAAAPTILSRCRNSTDRGK